MTRRRARLRPLAGALFVGLLLSGCASGATAATAAPPHSSAATGGDAVIAVGDSITEADSPSFDDGQIGLDSWAAYAGASDVRILGGWAHGGATTADMLAGVPTGNPWHADVLVLMAGNNDVDADVPFSTVEHNLDAIARKVGIGRVVLSTLAPEDAVAPMVEQLNAQLPALARSEGWQLVDPMRDIRDADGHYRSGMTDDGVHPTREGAQLIGQALHDAVTG